MSAIIATIIFLLIAPVIVYGVSSAFGALLVSVGQSEGEFISNLITNPVFQMLWYLLGVVIITLFVIYALLKLSGERWHSIGVLRPRWRDVGFALLGFVAYLTLYMLTRSVLASTDMPIDFDQRQELPFDTAIVGFSLAAVFIGLVVLPPLIEEILFRGFVYTHFKKALGTVVAVLLVSVLFAYGHLQLGTGNPLLWVAAIDTFILSLVLVYLREKTGTIWAGVGVHALKNGVAFLVLFILKLG